MRHAPLLHLRTHKGGFSDITRLWVHGKHPDTFTLFENGVAKKISKGQMKSLREEWDIRKGFFVVVEKAFPNLVSSRCLALQLIISNHWPCWLRLTGDVVRNIWKASVVEGWFKSKSFCSNMLLPALASCMPIGSSQGVCGADHFLLPPPNLLLK